MNKEQKTKPLIQWVWWKRRLLNSYENFFPKEYNRYFEPFVGWWAVFFHLEKDNSFISDINEELINLYKTVKTNPQEIIDFLKSQENSKETYDKIRSWDREENWKDKYSEVERAGRFMYLNRTCYNSLYRVNSKWQYNVPYSWKDNKDFIQEENILNVSKFLNKYNVDIKCQSFEKILEEVKAWDFVYLDPPYEPISKTASFTSYDKNKFWFDMQEKLKDFFVELDKKWVYVMLSNSETDTIKELYSDYRIELVEVRRNISCKTETRWKVNEVVILNY